MKKDFVDVERTNNWDQIKQILHTELGLTNIRESTFDEDTKECTDVVGYDTDNNTTRIAIRIRDHYYRNKYNDFTIRYTEYPKLKVKDIQYYLYGWHSPSGITEYYILDMKNILSSGILNKKWQLKYNHDLTKFYAIPFCCIVPTSIYVHAVI